MEDPVIVWILVAGVALLAVILGLAWQGASRRLQSSSGALQKARSTLEKLEKKLEERRRATDEKQGEIETLKKKLGKAKKRSASTRQERSTETTRLQSLEEDLDSARQTIQHLGDELQTLREAGPTSKAPDAKRAASHATDTRKIEPRAKRPTEPAGDEALQRLTQRASKAEAHAIELRRQLAETESELKRARGRSETNHRVYLVTKGELEAMNDRLHTLQRHLGSNSFGELLQAAGVAVGAKVGATVPLDPEAPAGVSAEQSLAADARAAVENQGEKAT